MAVSHGLRLTSARLLFVGLVYVLREIRFGAETPVECTESVEHPEPRPSTAQRPWNYRALLVTMLLASYVVSLQYGAVFLGKGFRGGFVEVDFEFDETERQKLQTLRSMVDRIPQGAAVAGSETLIPHVPVLNRRAALRHPDFQADYLLLHDRDFSQLEKESPRFLSLYDELERARELRLLKRR